MKKDYYINRNQQNNGDHEVHESSCQHVPSIQNRIYLGSFYNCKEAVDEAKRIYPSKKEKINGCYHCSNECHTS